MLQVEELDIDRNAVQRFESGKRVMIDIDLKVIVKVLEWHSVFFSKNAY